MERQFLHPISPQSSERLARHARARIPNDVRVREADYFDGSRAPESQGQKGSELATTENPKGEQTNLIAKRARRSRQNGWLGTRVRESQMTCVRVRVTTSSEVVHRRHRDDRGEEHEGQRK